MSDFKVGQKVILISEAFPLGYNGELVERGMQGTIVEVSLDGHKVVVSWGEIGSCALRTTDIQAMPPSDPPTRTLIHRR